MLRSVSFNAVLLVTGALLLLTGISGGFTTGSYAVAIQSGVLCSLLSVAGMGMVLFAIYAEVRPRLTRPARSITPAEPTATTHFWTLDEVHSKGFPSMVESALRVSILARTASNLLGQYQRKFEELGTRGCEIRLLLVDPKSDACEFLYGGHLEFYENSVRSTKSHLNRMTEAARRHLQVKVMDGAPTVSLLIVDKQDDKSSFLQAQIYLLHGATGRDRPIFRLRRNDKWYGVFRDEFEALWRNATPWDESSYVE